MHADISAAAGASASHAVGAVTPQSNHHRLHLATVTTHTANSAGADVRPVETRLHLGQCRPACRNAMHAAALQVLRLTAKGARAPGRSRDTCAAGREGEHAQQRRTSAVPALPDIRAAPREGVGLAASAMASLVIRGMMVVCVWRDGAAQPAHAGDLHFPAPPYPIYRRYTPRT